MVRLNDLIVTHENSLNATLCDSLVSFFDSNSDKHEVIDQGGKPNFTQLNLTRNREEKEVIHNQLIQTVFKHRDEYYKYVYRDVFPDSHAFEEFRIKRYNTGGEDRFDTHVDVKDHSSARRFFIFLLVFE